MKTAMHTWFRPEHTVSERKIAKLKHVERGLNTRLLNEGIKHSLGTSVPWSDAVDVITSDIVEYIDSLKEHKDGIDRIRAFLEVLAKGPVAMMKAKKEKKSST